MNETFLGLIISQRHIVPLPSEVLVASGLYCKILTLYKIIKLIQCTVVVVRSKAINYLHLQVAVVLRDADND